VLDYSSMMLDLEFRLSNISVQKNALITLTYAYRERDESMRDRESDQERDRESDRESDRDRDRDRDRERDRLNSYKVYLSYLVKIPLFVPNINIDLIEDWMYSVFFILKRDRDLRVHERPHKNDRQYDFSS
jgi:hypothetical protein